MFFREHHSSNLSFGWSGGGGATIVLEDLGADAPATVTRAEFGMCAGHGVRSPTSSKVQEAGPSHGLGRGVRPLRSLRGCRASPQRSWARGRCRGSGHRHISKLQRLGGANFETFEPFKHKNNSHLGARCKQTTRTRCELQTNNSHQVRDAKKQMTYKM